MYKSVIFVPFSIIHNLNYHKCIFILLLNKASKTLPSQKKFMMDNDGNGTCYTKTEYDSLGSKYDSMKWVIMENTEASKQQNFDNIQNCDSIFRMSNVTVKGNFPMVNEIPEGYKALKSEDKENWQKNGGLAKCVDEGCPKMAYGNTEHIKKRLQNLAGNNEAAELAVFWPLHLFVLCLGYFFINT